MGPSNILQPPTICIENLTKDDIELYTKKQPNIIITIASTISPPTSSPPETPNKSKTTVTQSKAGQNTTSLTTSTTNTATVAKQTEQEFAIQQLEQFKLAAQKAKQTSTGGVEQVASIQFPSTQITSTAATTTTVSNQQLNAQQLISTTATISATTNVSSLDGNTSNELVSQISLPSSMPPAKQAEQKEEFELISFQEDIYEKHFYGKEHWVSIPSHPG